MTTKQTILLVTVIFVVSIGIGAYFYPLLPDMVASHWGMNGEVNGYMSKFWGLFLLPIIMIFISALLFWLPTIDPLKENVEQFRKLYNSVIAGIVVFLFYIHLLTVFWNAGYHFDMGKMVVPPLALLFYLLGSAMPKMKQNWFMGIRTPWTLESERVWSETHTLAGKLFRASAIISIVGIFFPEYAFWFIIVPILVSSFGSVIYSYVLFQKYGSDKKK